MAKTTCRKWWRKERADVRRDLSRQARRGTRRLLADPAYNPDETVLPTLRRTEGRISH